MSIFTTSKCPFSAACHRALTIRPSAMPLLVGTQADAQCKGQLPASFAKSADARACSSSPRPRRGIWPRRGTDGKTAQRSGDLLAVQAKARTMPVCPFALAINSAVDPP